MSDSFIHSCEFCDHTTIRRHCRWRRRWQVHAEQEPSLTPTVINDFRLQEVGVRPRAYENARHESRIRAAQVEATDMQASRQKALEDRVVAPRHHVHQAPAEPVRTAIQLRIRYAWPIQLLRSPAGSTNILWGAASSSMGVSVLLPIWLPYATFCCSVPDDFGTTATAEATDWPGWPTILLRDASLVHRLRGTNESNEYLKIRFPAGSAFYEEFSSDLCSFQRELSPRHLKYYLKFRKFSLSNLDSQSFWKPVNIKSRLNRDSGNYFFLRYIDTRK